MADIAALAAAETVGERIRYCRERVGETREDLAYAIGVKAVTIGRYERNERDIPHGVLIALADHFGVTTDYILARKDRATPPSLSGKSESGARIGGPANVQAPTMRILP